MGHKKTFNYWITRISKHFESENRSACLDLKQKLQLQLEPARRRSQLSLDGTTVGARLSCEKLKMQAGDCNWRWRRKSLKRFINALERKLKLFFPFPSSSLLPISHTSPIRLQLNTLWRHDDSKCNFNLRSRKFRRKVMRLRFTTRHW